MQNTCGMNNQHLCFFEWNVDMPVWTYAYTRVLLWALHRTCTFCDVGFALYTLAASWTTVDRCNGKHHPSIHPWFIPSPTKQQFRTSERSIIKGTYIVCVLHDHRPHICRSNTFRVKRPDDRSCGEMDIRTFLLKLSECEATRHALPQCDPICLLLRLIYLMSFLRKVNYTKGKKIERKWEDHDIDLQKYFLIYK